MTNFEKWNKEIGELKDNLAVVDDKPCVCGSTSCHDCEFGKNLHCVFAKWYWLWEEYKEVEK